MKRKEKKFEKLLWNVIFDEKLSNEEKLQKVEKYLEKTLLFWKEFTGGLNEEDTGC